MGKLRRDDFLKIYHEASEARRKGLPDEALKGFEALIRECADPAILSGAHYHLAMIREGRQEREAAGMHLLFCLIHNPAHRDAGRMINDLGGTAAFSAMIPALSRIAIYQKALLKTADFTGEQRARFREFLEKYKDKKGMQVGVRGHKIAPHWISVDKFDCDPLIDVHDDIHELSFAAGAFDAVVCNAVLEHVEDPVRAISELHRVLKTGGAIWIEVPFNQPYHPSPGDYWRVTPLGIKIWFKQFREISSGLFLIDGSPLYNGVYFYGVKS